MIFAPIVQIANECHCFICTRSKLSDHNTCTICKLIFDFSNCTIDDCVTNRRGLTRFHNKCRHATIRCKCTKCLHSTLLPHNYMSINILRSVDKGKNHLHACMHLSALTSDTASQVHTQNGRTNRSLQHRENVFSVGATGNTRPLWRNV